VACVGLESSWLTLSGQQSSKTCITVLAERAVNGARRVIDETVATPPEDHWTCGCGTNCQFGSSS